MTNRRRLAAILLIAGLPGCAFVGLPGTDVRGCTGGPAAMDAPPAGTPLLGRASIGRE